MTKEDTIEEIAYNTAILHRGAGGCAVPTQWADLPKTERKRWINIAKAIRTHILSQMKEKECVELAFDQPSCEERGRTVTKCCRCNYNQAIKDLGKILGEKNEL